MTRATPPFLAMLLVLSLIVVPAATGSESSGRELSGTDIQNQISTINKTNAGLLTLENTTNRLSLGNNTKSDYTEYSTDVGTMLASTDDELQDDHAQYTLIDREFDDATTEERRELLRDAYEETKERSNALESREQRAVRAHANGELSSVQLLQTLVRNHKEAAVLSKQFEELDKRSDQISDFSLSIDDDQDKLEMHRSEIRSQLEMTARGHEMNGDSEIAIETSENGYVISMLNENYYREAVRYDNRDTSQPIQFNGTMDAYGRAQELYPWAYETGRSPLFNEHTTVQLYLIDISHEQGHLEAYLDGGTGEIYREVQELDPDSLPIDEQTWGKNETDLTLPVNRTPVNGPVELAVINPSTDEPVQATITINGIEIGDTSEDGIIWFAPPTEDYSLQAEAINGNENATVTAVSR